MKTEAVVNALIEYAAQAIVAFKYQYVRAVLFASTAAAIPAGPPPIITTS